MLHLDHPDETVLESYCMNKLEGEPLDAIEDHLLLCSKCQDRVTATDSFVRGMRSALSARPLAVVPRWNLARYFQMPVPVWATAAVACAGLLGVIVTQNLNPSNLPVAIALTATRGGVVPVGRAGSPLDLNLDVRDLAPVFNNRVQIVNSDGGEVWSGTASPVQNGQIHAHVQLRLAAGQYFVRVADSAGAHREYALRLGN